MNRGTGGISRALQFVGPRGAALTAICVALPMLLAAVEYALALILILLLYTLHLAAPTQLPAWVQPIVTRASPAAILVGLAAVGLVRAVAVVASYQARGLLAEGTHARMQMALAYRALMATDATALPLSEMGLYTGEIFPKATEYLLRFAQATAALIQAVILGVGTFALAPWPAVVGLAGMGAIGGGMLRLNRLTNRVGTRVQQARADLERTKVRIARNRLLIRIFGLEEAEYTAWLQSAFSYFRNNTLAYVFGHLAGALMPVCGLALIAGIVLANARFFHTPAVSLVAFFYLFYRVQQLLAGAAMEMGGLAWYRPQADRAMELVLSLPPDERRAAMRPEAAFRITRRAFATPPSGPPRTSSRRTNGQTPAPAITLQSASFGWQGMETLVLRDLTIEVEPGTQLAVVGPNGSGKSTLLCLILGALRPSNGEVRVGGEASEVWVRAHAHAIAYVGPEPYLIHGSVRQNLTYGGDGRCSEPEIWDALANVGLDDFFRELPGGLDYGIQENGDGLSSGQKQRIAIARGILRRPSLFVMDEPSANLDAQSEARILDVLAGLRRRCTVVIVSHRPGMLRDADRVVELEGLQVVATA